MYVLKLSVKHYLLEFQSFQKFPKYAGKFVSEK